MKKILFTIILLSLVLTAGCARNKAAENSQAEPAKNNEPVQQQSIKPKIEIETKNLFKRDDFNFVYAANIDKSRVEWTGRRFDGQAHSGTIKLKEGQVFVKDGKVVNGLFIIDMATIDAPGESGLVKHLKSADFFDTAKYPQADLIINRVEEKGENSEGDMVYSAVGKLKIKGINQEIKFEAAGKLDTDKETFRAQAKFSIDRTRWNIRYGSGKFFKGLGDQAIDDIIDYKIFIEAIKVKP